jgi:hypothetical protein
MRKNEKNQKTNKEKEITSSVSKLLCLIQNVSFLIPESNSENFKVMDFSFAV